MFARPVLSLGLAAALAMPAQAETLAQTRFGILSKTENGVLAFRGRSVKPLIEANNDLFVQKLVRIGAQDVALMQIVGGTACPALLHLVVVSSSGVKGSPEFGTCSDLITVKQAGSSLVLTMPGFRGPFEPEAEQRRAARQTFTYVFKLGKLTENGKLIWTVPVG